MTHRRSFGHFCCKVGLLAAELSRPPQNRQNISLDGNFNRGILTHQFQVCVMALRRTVFVLTPIVLLVAEFFSFPALFENKPTIKSINLMSLLASGGSQLGIFRAHRTYVSLDDIAATDYLYKLRDARNALLISGFKHEDRSVSVAALGGAVLKKLQAISPADYHSVLEQWLQKTHLRPGEVLITKLEVPAD